MARESPLGGDGRVEWGLKRGNLGREGPPRGQIMETHGYPRSFRPGGRLMLRSSSPSRTVRRPRNQVPPCVAGVLPASSLPAPSAVVRRFGATGEERAAPRGSRELWRPTDPIGVAEDLKDRLTSGLWKRPKTGRGAIRFSADYEKPGPTMRPPYWGQNRSSARQSRQDKVVLCLTLE